jgi:hypothetical protein
MTVARSGGRDPWRLSVLAAHLFALCGFAVAQPLYDLINRLSALHEGTCVVTLAASGHVSHTTKTP